MLPLNTDGNQVSSLLHISKQLEDADKLHLGIHQEQHIQKIIEVMTISNQHTIEELKKRYNHFTNIVNQEIDQDFLNEQARLADVLYKQASGYVLLVKKLKERTDGFVQQNLPRQMSCLQEQLQAFQRFQDMIVQIYRDNLMNQEASLFLGGLQRIKFLQSKEGELNSMHSKMSQSFLWQVFSERRLVCVRSSDGDQEDDE